MDILYKKCKQNGYKEQGLEDLRNQRKKNRGELRELQKKEKRREKEEVKHESLY